MRALLLRGPRQAEVVEVPRPTPGPEEVLLRVRACGVCGSDLNAWRGVPGLEYPRPAGHPGHEVWGEVVEPAPGRGEVVEPAPGRGEVVEPAPGRGEAVEPARGGTVAALA